MTDLDDAQPQIITIHCKFGKDTLPVSISSNANIQDLKEKLQQLTNALPRGQKIIHKGKTLDMNISLKDANLSDGSKVMIIASQGVHQGSATVAKRQLVKVQNVGVASDSAQLKSVTKTRVDMWRATGIISLRDSGLTTVPSDIWAMGSSARIFDAGGNHLERFPREVCSLVKLQKLRLSANGLNDQQMDWQGIIMLKELTVLALDHNLLTSMPPEVGLLSSLKYLSVAHNNLGHVPQELGNLSSLESLSVLPSSLGACGQLLEVNLSANLLQEVPSTLGCLINLKALYLGNNALKSFPNSILKGCVELSTLSLHGNELTIEYLREMDGWADFDNRRKSKHSKQLEFNILGSSGGFDEGADAHQWHHW